MKVRDQDPRDGLAAERGEQPLPQLSRVPEADPGVDDRDAVLVVEQPEIDVVQRERQRYPEPSDSRRDRDRLAGTGRLGPGVKKAILRGNPVAADGHPTDYISVPRADRSPESPASGAVRIVVGG